MVEINTILNLKIKKQKKKSYFEIIYATIIKINDEIKTKKN